MSQCLHSKHISSFSLLKLSSTWIWNVPCNREKHTLGSFIDIKANFLTIYFILLLFHVHILQVLIRSKGRWLGFDYTVFSVSVLFVCSGEIMEIVFLQQDSWKQFLEGAHVWIETFSMHLVILAGTLGWCLPFCVSVWWWGYQVCLISVPTTIVGIFFGLPTGSQIKTWRFIINYKQP